MAKDVIVVVQRDASPKEKENLDILLVSTTGEQPVAVYRDKESVEAVFGPDGPTPNAKIVRKAKTLLNQGKTTLADTLVSKFKIVGFEPPSSSPALPAKLTLTFAAGEVLFEEVPKDTPLWAKIGGDDKAVISLTANKELSSTSDFAALFKGKSFTKGGKTYNATVKSNVVTFTATEPGEADSIPERFSVFTDEIMTADLGLMVETEFTNGVNFISAPDNLVNTIDRFKADVDRDWYYLMTDRDEDEYLKALSKYAEASEPTEAELGVGVEDRRNFYMGQTCNKNFSCNTARAAIIYSDEKYLSEEPDASYTGNVAPFYPNSVTWKFKRPQDGNAPTSEGAKLITLPQLTEGERDQLLENHVNFLTDEYRNQYVKEGVCLNGEYIDTILGGDWIAKRMRNLFYEILLTHATIQYSDGGFALVATAVLQTLAEAADLGIIARDVESKSGVYTVVIPKYSESTEEQRRNRVMPDITWEALLAGAVHQVKSKGVLRASL